MVKLSKKTTGLLRDDIISVLYSNSLRPLFTNEIATELRRDNEFVKKLLLDLKKEGLVELVQKNNKGQNYLTHQKWRIPPKVLAAYKSQK